MRKILCFSLRKNTKKYAHDNLCFLHNLRMMRILYLWNKIVPFFFAGDGKTENKKKQNSDTSIQENRKYLRDKKIPENTS